VEPFHERLARLALAVAERYGFALAGGYAMEAHGLVHRASEDVDLFTDAAGGPGKVAGKVIEAYQQDGLTVDVDRLTDDFVRLVVSDDAIGHASNVELCRDWRAFPPVRLEMGAVLSLEDAVASKVLALFGRAFARDFIDVDAAAARIDRQKLLDLAAEHDPGFDRSFFTEQLRELDHIPDEELAAYGLGPAEITGLRMRFADWRLDLLRG